MDNTLTQVHGAIQRNPKQVFYVIGVLIVLVIILYYLYSKSKSAATTAGFRRSGYQNAAASLTGRHGPYAGMWWLGDSDQPQIKNNVSHPNSWPLPYNAAAGWSKNSLYGQAKAGHHMRIARATAAHRAKVHRAKMARMRGMRLRARREGLSTASTVSNVSMDSTCDPALAGSASDMCAASGGQCSDTGASGSDGLDVWGCSSLGTASAAMVQPDANGNCPAGFSYDSGSGACLNMSAAGPLDVNTGYEGGGSDFMYTSCPDPTAELSAAWDPDATSEAQALAAVGSYMEGPSDDLALFEAAVQSADGPDASSGSLTDAQLGAIVPGTVTAP